MVDLHPLLSLLPLAAVRTGALAHSAVPSPGEGIAPPGSQGIITILQWGAWSFTACGVGGILFAAGRMFFDHRAGQSSQGLGHLMWVLLGIVIGGAAAGIVTTLMQAG